jgi:hypothetical protein
MRSVLSRKEAIVQITLVLEAGLFQLAAQNGQSVLLQSDWDFPKAASLFGFVPCPCGQTDGTIRCPHRAPREMIEHALAFLWKHVGESTEDPGYF